MTTSRGWDEELQAGKKTLRTLPGALLLGPTGARLWADYLEPVPGFSGRFDFIHKMNIPLLYKVTNNLVTSFDPCETSWFPSYLHMQYNGRRLSFTEEKFISWDDCAVSCQTWTNSSEEELCLKLVTYRDAFTEREGCHLNGGFSIETYSFDIDGVIVVSDESLFNEVLLKPGETKQFVISAAVGIRGVDPRELLAERAAAYANGPASGKAIVKKQQMAYDTWLAKAPRFDSSDLVLNKTWSYRWFVLRHNLADPKYGYLQYPLFYEGRSHKKSKSPFSKGGWEFSKLIPLSVP
ncbi:MAG: hypothetical protein JWN30_2816, partial [Bacilli bacterium]|nr:hypothetical protein [Bacilli bacterium]